MSRLFFFLPTNDNALALPPDTEAYKLARELFAGGTPASDFNAGKLLMDYIDADGDTSFMYRPSAGEGMEPLLLEADPGTVAPQIEQAVADSIRENVNNPATTPQVQAALTEGMTELTKIESRIKAESGNINSQGIDIETSHNAYMDYASGAGDMETAAQAMVADIKAAIATGQMSAGEVARLQGVLTDLIGSADLAEVYVSNVMDVEAESGYNDGKSKVQIVLPNQPHTNGTEGHWETILDQIDLMVKSGFYRKIYSNKGLSNEIPEIKPNRRPDIMGIRHDGIIDQIEVPSKTDDPAALLERMMENTKLMGKRGGSVKVIPIKK